MEDIMVCALTIEGDSEDVEKFKKTVGKEDSLFSFKHLHPQFRIYDRLPSIDVFDIKQNIDGLETVTYLFKARHRPPHEWVQELSYVFNRLEVTLEYADVFNGYGGLDKFENGVVIDFEVSRSFFQARGRKIVPVERYKVSDDNNNQCLRVNTTYDEVINKFHQLTKRH